MARLPQVGADEGQWGQVLNDYLATSHANDGTLKADTVGASQLQNGSVGATKIAGLGANGGVAKLDSDGTPITATNKPVLIEEDLDAKVSALVSDTNSDVRSALDSAFSGAAEGRFIRELFQPISDEPFPAAQLSGSIVIRDDEPSSWFTNHEYSDAILWNDPQLRWLTGTPQAVVPGSPNNGCITRTTGATNNQAQIVSFYYTGSHVVWQFTSYGEGSIAVYIDNKRAFYDYAAPGVHYLSIPFASYGAHQIEIAFGFNVPSFMLTLATERILPGPARFKMGLDGDSYTDIGQNPDFGGLAQELFETTGFAITGLGQGSTGWAAQNDSVTTSKEPYGGTKRIAAKKAANLDLLLVLGSVNDGAQSAATIQAAGTAYFSALSELPIIVAGPERHDWGSAGHAANNVALKTSAAAANNVLGFIDWYEELWQTGTGYVGGETGDGNQDHIMGADQIHANRIGNKYFARLFTDRIGNFVYKKPA